MIRRPPRSTLFPYPPLSRSCNVDKRQAAGDRGTRRHADIEFRGVEEAVGSERDRKSTRLNSSHSQISYAVFCLKKKKNTSKIMTSLILNIEQMRQMLCI